MERVIYKNNGGLGLILTNESESDCILAEDVILHGEILKPGDMTSIDGMFTAPMRYAGTIVLRLAEVPHSRNFGFEQELSCGILANRCYAYVPTCLVGIYLEHE